MPLPVISKLIRIILHSIVFLHQSDAYFFVSKKNVVILVYGSILGFQPDEVTPIILTPGAARGYVVSGFSPGIPCGAALSFTESENISKCLISK